MPITVQWDNDQKTTIRYEFAGRWTWEQLFAANDERDAMMKTVDYRVDLIADLRNTMVVPPGAASQFKRIAQARAGTGVTVVVGANRFMQIMLDVFKLVQRQSESALATAGSLEEARALLARRRADRTGSNR